MVHLETEAVVEALRQKLNKNPTFVHQECFDQIDYDGDGYINVLEVWKSDILLIFLAENYYG